MNNCDEMKKIEYLEMKLGDIYLLLIGYLKGHKDLSMEQIIQDRFDDVNKLIREIKGGEIPISISDLMLSVRTTNVLCAMDICEVKDLLQKTLNEIINFPSLGKKGVSEIREALEKFNLKLKE